MPIDAATIGDKFRRYREQLQLTPANIHEQTGITPARLAEIEAGTVPPSGDEVLVLSDVFRCDFRFFITNEKQAPFEETETLYRKHGDAFSKPDRLAVQEFLYLCESEAYLEQLAGRVPNPLPPIALKGSHFKSHGEQAAAAVRARLPDIRANVFDQFRSLGFHIFRRKLVNSNISGLCLRHHKIGPCILINYTEDPYRQRFSCAHEACHAILDRGDDVVVSFKSGSTSQERRANSFAASFLLPPNALTSLPDPASWSDDDFRAHAHSLMVNAKTLAIALHEAHRIDTAKFQEWGALRLPKSNKPDPELPANLPPNSRRRALQMLERGLTTHLVHLGFDALHNQRVSRARLAGMLLLDPPELAEVAELFHEALS